VEQNLLPASMLMYESCSRTPHSNAYRNGGETAQRFCRPAP
jgi:hypothetical protein